MIDFVTEAKVPFLYVSSIGVAGSVGGSETIPNPEIIPYKANGYSDAVKVLNSDKLLKNDAEVKEKIAYYNNKKPVLLSSLEPYEGELGYVSESVTDVVNKKYQEYLKIILSWILVVFS